MADIDVTNQDNQRLSNLRDKLHDQLDKFCDVEALLNCALERLLEECASSDDSRRVICIAQGIMTDIHKQIDLAELEASQIIIEAGMAATTSNPS